MLHPYAKSRDQSQNRTRARLPTTSVEHPGLHCCMQMFWLTLVLTKCKIKSTSPFHAAAQNQNTIQQKPIIAAIGGIKRGACELTSARRGGWEKVVRNFEETRLWHQSIVWICFGPTAERPIV